MAIYKYKSPRQILPQICHLTLSSRREKKIPSKPQEVDGNDKEEKVREEEWTTKKNDGGW